MCSSFSRTLTTDWIRALVVGCAAIVGRLAIAAPVIEGNSTYLEVFHDAIVTGKAAFRKGRVTGTVTVHTRSNAAGLPKVAGKEDRRFVLIRRDEITLTWLDDKQRCRGVVTQSSELESEQTSTYDVIHTPKETITSTSDSKGSPLIRISERIPMSGRLEPTSLSPEALWFATPFLIRPDMADFFVPEKQLKSVSQILIKEIDEGRIRVEYVMKGSSGGVAGRAWCVNDLSQGANVIETGFETVELGLQLATRTWEHAHNKSWRLKRYDEKFTRPNEDVPWHEASFTVASFDPAPDIPLGYFEIAAFPRDAMTTITDSRGGRIRVRRAKDEGITEDVLRKLAIPVSSEGFAFPRH